MYYLYVMCYCSSIFVKPTLCLLILLTEDISVIISLTIIVSAILYFQFKNSTV